MSLNEREFLEAWVYGKSLKTKKAYIKVGRDLFEFLRPKDWRHATETDLKQFLELKSWQALDTKKQRVASRKNRTYLAFRELGYVIRTLFLLEHIGSRELRSQVHAATTRSESFNDFLQWIVFGGDGEIKNNDRDQQRKTIKYSHLLANLMILYNVQALSKAIRDLKNEGLRIDEELLAHISPYLRSHINRFGEYRLDLNKKAEALDFESEKELILGLKPAPVKPLEPILLH